MKTALGVTSMNPQVKRDWIAALRSGDYKQGRHVLRRGSQFCCLGVLCNLHAQAHPEIAAKQTDPGMYMGKSQMPPNEVLEWAGLSLYDARQLASKNDFGQTFDSISYFIDARLA